MNGIAETPPRPLIRGGAASAVPATAAEMRYIAMESRVGFWREMAIFVPDNGIVVTFISSTTVGFRSPSVRTGCGFSLLFLLNP